LEGLEGFLCTHNEVGKVERSEVIVLVGLHGGPKANSRQVGWTVVEGQRKATLRGSGMLKVDEMGSPNGRYHAGNCRPAC